MNLHNPERYADESQADYRARRAASNVAVRMLNADSVLRGFRQHTNRSKPLSKRAKHRNVASYSKPQRTVPKFKAQNGKKRQKFSLPTHGRTNPLAMLRIER